MSDRRVPGRWALRLACAMILTLGAAGQDLPTILQVKTECRVNYYNPMTDASQLARTPGMVTFTPSNFLTSVIISDVTAVNGSPMKGVHVIQQQLLTLTPTPDVGHAISDVTRNGAALFFTELLHSDGSPIGSIFGIGMNGGASPPGSPVGSISSNIAIVGGTGALLGARGVIAVSQGVRAG